MEYEYDIEEEGFRRVDRRGRMLPINITEARRVASLVDLGLSADAIHDKMVYTQGAVTRTTTKSFIKNLKEGNINLDGDYPAPSRVMDNMDIEARLTDLERRVKSLEEFSCSCKSENPKGWKNLWGAL